MNIIKSIIIYAIVLIASYITSVYFGDFYNSLFGSSDAFDIDLTALVGMVFSYVFFLPLLYTLFGNKHKNKLIGILLTPPAIILILGDFRHIYFPITLGLVGWVLGLGILKLKQILVPLKHH